MGRRRRAKRWSELSRRQRTSVRAFIRDDIKSLLDGSVPGDDARFEQRWVEGMRAAIQHLAAPKRTKR